jgi:hypothetical protein
MLSRRLYEIVALACGFILIDYGFSLLAAGFLGTRQLTSQFLGFNLLAGGSVVVFISLFYLLKPATPITPSTQPSGRAPDVGIAILGSIGRLGAQEERKYANPALSATPTTAPPPSEIARAPLPSYPQVLEMQIGDFSKSTSGEYERQLSGTVYDMFRVESETVSVWRENRLGMRSVYLAGPYELSRKLMEVYASRGVELKIGYLSISFENLRDLMKLQESQNPHQADHRGSGNPS